MERLQDFVSACNTNFNPKVADLYKERYIQYVRTAVHENIVYVTLSVWAEMKKSVNYKVDASLTKDGVVSESQCECAAGQGSAAHCKHVLQTFHQSNAHRGSPLKLKNFHEATGKESGHKLYDPRTNAVNKDKIRKRHRDGIINWPEKPARLAVMQLFPAANRKAVGSDHDYMDYAPEEKYLIDEKSVLGDTYSVVQSCVSGVINGVTDILYRISLREINMPRGMEETTATKRKFFRIANFPHVIGIIDGTHVPIAAPSQVEEVYVNRKKFHSLNVQVVCDADYVVLNFCTRFPGSTHDSYVWHNSNLYRQFQQGEFGNSVLLGDSGYPLEPNLMVPVGQPANAAEGRYNTSLKKTRVVVEQTIGIWKARFKCVHQKGGTLSYTPLKCGKMAAATFLLHNYCRRRNIPLLDDPEDPDDPNPAPAAAGARLAAVQARRRQMIQEYFS
ncbi:hypothetical protein Pcinc_010768 [Petrolisthes cinctipes]|uniref:Putative nuclease HARBI1 n=1 Tax=Petrolisthes cinctipes TaxID=88211 RepID=A0AAE1G2J2_PETCI|nr:hypothetical protein Pcinc_010768 [Petrolisthes cinctipes]